MVKSSLVIFVILLSSIVFANEQSQYRYKEASSRLDFRILRRMAVGAQAVGALGIGGTVVEMNFAPPFAVNLGYGGGTGFQAWEVQTKYILGGKMFSPYLTAGYARWISSGKQGSISESTPSVLANQFLTDGEKFAGEFQKNIAYTSFGLQFLQTSGDWVGASLYLEIMMLVEMQRLVAAPTGTLGALYYF